MKVTIERKDGNAWKQANAELKHTRNNNLSCQYDGQILVFPNLHEGSKVVGLENGKWAKVGRVTRTGLIFLGESPSYSEQCEQLFQGRKEELAARW